MRGLGPGPDRIAERGPPIAGDRQGRVLIGGVGYHFLRDFSAGPAAVAALAGERPSPRVVVEDLSYGPIAVVHRLNEALPPFTHLVAIAAVERGRAPGSLTAYRWDAGLPDEEEIQARVAEAVTGVIGLENLLIVAARLGALPRDVAVLEIEPLVEASGEAMTAEVSAATERAARLALELAGHPAGWVRLPVAPLGGPGHDAGPGRAADVGGGRDR